MFYKLLSRVKSPLLLSVAAGMMLPLSPSPGLANDYCYMRTSEGEYIGLNSICGPSAQGGFPNRSYQSQPTEPNSTSTTRRIIRDVEAEIPSLDEAESLPEAPGADPDAEPASDPDATEDMPNSTEENDGEPSDSGEATRSEENRLPVTDGD